MHLPSKKTAHNKWGKVHIVENNSDLNILSQIIIVFYINIFYYAFKHISNPEAQQKI
jgi:hypothetical protein